MTELPGYVFSEVLQTSKFFMVYRGIRISDQQPVVIKTCHLDPPPVQALSSLQQEYYLLQQLDSGLIVRAYDFIKQKGTPFLILEDTAGVPLCHYLKDKTLEIEVFLSIAIDLTSALSQVHQQQIIHKDLNPNNIVIEPSSLALKLIDFGIASQIPQETLDFIQPQKLEGTLAYISPEQTGRMNRSIDYRTDFYSLGATLYDMLTGQPPFTITDPLALIHCHLAREPNSVDKLNGDVPPALASIIHKLLAKTPEERYLNAIGIKKDLEECQRQWKAHRRIEPFPLGQQDFSDRLIFSQKLYGREKQAEQLMSSFDRICQGNKELVLVSGYSGIGKTSLVKEIYPPITQMRGYFIKGKFDQLNRATPYSALVEAFQELVRSFLAEPEDHLQTLKKAILEAVGNNGQVIIEVLPALNLILGEQPPVPILAPQESQNRFMLTFQNFVRALAQPGHPLGLFLDDLQWADSASLQLLNLILSDPEVGHLLVIGAYRDNEVLEGHPLLQLFAQLEKSKVSCNSIVLNPLSEENVQQFLANSLNDTMSQTGSLFKILYSKTQGNPYFLIQFLKTLHQQRMLIFSYETRQWQWDEVKIREMNITDNVVDLLNAHIRQLPEETQTVLKLAACIGHIFDLHTLSLICKQPVTAITQQMWKLIQLELIRPLGNAYLLPEQSASDTSDIRYQFMHDRIQQTAYQLIDETQRQQTNLTIGRLLKESVSPAEQEARLFEIVNHYNQGLSLITALEERVWLAEAGLRAGKKAKLATAYAIAHDYLQAGIDVLPGNDWEERYSLMFALHKEITECKYLMVNYEEAQQYFKELLKKVQNSDDKIEIYLLQILMHNTLHKFNEAIETSIQALRELGIDLPLRPKIYHILLALIKVKRHTLFKNKNKIKNLELVPMTDPRLKQVLEICQHLFSPTYFTNQDLFLLIALRLVDTSLKFGYMSVSHYVYWVYSMTSLHHLNNTEEGFAFAWLADKLQQKLPLLTGIPSRGHLIKGLFITHFQAPFNQTLEDLLNAYNLAMEGGDLEFGNITYAAFATNSYAVGRPLSEVVKKCQDVLAFQDRFDFHISLVVVDIIIVSCQFLQNTVSPAGSPLSYLKQAIPLLHTLDDHEDKTKISVIYSLMTQFCYLCGCYTEALLTATKQQEYKRYTRGTLSHIYGVFYAGLSFAKACDQIAGKERRLAFKKLQSIHKQFTRWTQIYPKNFYPFERLLAAEIERIKGHSLIAMDCYDQAIAAGEENECLHFNGVANECALQFYLQLKKPQFAHTYAIKAYHAYEQWGATVKTGMLKEEYPQWFMADMSLEQRYGTVTSTVRTLSQQGATSTHSLDLQALFQSAEAIFKEIEQDKLIKTLMQTLLHSSGAQRGYLLIKEKEEWRIKAESKTDTLEVITLLLDTAVEQRTEIPRSLITYVQRTGERVLLQTNKEIEAYQGQDPYIAEVRPQSILFLPLMVRGELTRILYLENRSIPYAFTPGNLQTLELLASQAAIALANAQLYYEATHDVLTGLPNRSFMYYSFELAVKRANKNNTMIAILFLDLDGFKKINDTLGHRVGDNVLLYFSEQLKLCLQGNDTAIRLGGDEFVLMLEDIQGVPQVNKVVDNLLERLSQPAVIEDHPIQVGTSIGISLYPTNNTAIGELLKQADLALYQVKRSKKGRYQFYSPLFEDALPEADPDTDKRALRGR